MWTRTGRHVNQGYNVLFEKLPEVERGQAARGGYLPNAKQNPMGREGRHFGQSPAGQGERSPPEGLGNHQGLRRGDRVTE